MSAAVGRPKPRLRNYRYRLYPTAEQAQALTDQLAFSCDLYNALLQERRDAFAATAQEVGRKRPWHPSDGNQWPAPVKHWDTDAKKHVAIKVPSIGVDLKTQSKALTELRQSGFPFPEGMAAGLQHEVIRRVEKTYKAYFAGIEKGRRVGPPRFRSRSRYDSLTFQLSGPSKEKFDENGNSLGRGFTSGSGRLHEETLYLTGIGSFALRSDALRRSGPGSSIDKTRRQSPRRNGLRQHRAIPGGGIAKTVTVLRSCGRWYAIVSVELPPVDPHPDNRPGVGIDLGVITWATAYSDSPEAIAATAADLDYQQPRIGHGGDANSLRIDGSGAGEKHARHVRITQRRVARRTRRGHAHSHRRKKAVLLYGRAKERERQARADHRHKVTTVIARHFGRIGMEDLDIAKMTRAPKNEPDLEVPAKLKEDLNRKILDKAWYEFRLVQTYKAEDAGGSAEVVPAAYSTQECSECGEIVPMPPSQRWFVCPRCGNKQGRTRNAAKNVFQRMEQPDGAHPSGVKASAVALRTTQSPRLGKVANPSRTQNGGRLAT